MRLPWLLSGCRAPRAAGCGWGAARFPGCCPPEAEKGGARFPETSSESPGPPCEAQAACLPLHARHCLPSPASGCCGLLFRDTWASGNTVHFRVTSAFSPACHGPVLTAVTTTRRQESENGNQNLFLTPRPREVLWGVEAFAFPPPPRTTPVSPSTPTCLDSGESAAAFRKVPTAPPSSQAKFLGCFPRESVAFCLGAPCVHGCGSWWLSVSGCVTRLRLQV